MYTNQREKASTPERGWEVVGKGGGWVGEVGGECGEGGLFLPNVCSNTFLLAVIPPTNLGLANWVGVVLVRLD